MIAACGNDRIRCKGDVSVALAIATIDDHPTADIYRLVAVIHQLDEIDAVRRDLIDKDLVKIGLGVSAFTSRPVRDLPFSSHVRHQAS